jgi:hypothetical protein
VNLMERTVAGQGPPIEREEDGRKRDIRDFDELQRGRVSRDAENYRCEWIR